MNKVNVINTINEAKSYAQKQIGLNNQVYLYQKSLTYLDQMLDSLNKGSLADKTLSPSVQLDSFVTKDIEASDRQFSELLSRATFQFDDYFDLLGPDFKSLTKQ